MNYENNNSPDHLRIPKSYNLTVEINLINNDDGK